MEKYATITNLLKNTYKEIVESKVFKMGSFLVNMETEFTRWGLRDKNVGGVDSILLIRLDAVGDFVLTSAAIREVRMNYPNAHITLVVSNRAYPVAEFCPYVNEVLPFDIEFNFENVATLIAHVGNFARKYLWKRQFRLAFTFRYFPEWSTLQLIMTYFSGARIRVGYDIKAGYIYTGRQPSNKIDVAKKLLTHPISASTEIVHDCARSLYLLKAFGLEIHNTNQEVWYNAADSFHAKKLLEGFAPNRIKIIAGICASSPVRAYPVEKYITAFKEIIELGAAVIIVGGPDDEENANFFAENLPAEYVKNLAPIKTGWRIDAAVMSQADMYIGNMTGNCNIAEAVGLPVIALSRVAKDCPSPNEVEVYAPWQTNFIVIQPEHQLGDCQKKNYWAGCFLNMSHCIAQIEPDEIVDAYKKMVVYLVKSAKHVQTPNVVKSVKYTAQLLSVK